MKINKLRLPLFLLSLVITSLACTIFVGGPDYSNLPPIPVSAEAAESIKEELRRAFEAGAQTGVVTINITEPQITSYLAARLQTDPSLQQSDIAIIVTMGMDPNGQPLIEITSADFGPFPAPEGLKDAITAMVREAYTGSLGPVATGLRIDTISIATGVMTITGRIR
jgi:hypothetical protein